MQDTNKMDYTQVIKKFLPGGNIVPDQYNQVAMTYYASEPTAGVAQVVDIVCKADIESNLNGTFFTYSTPSAHYVFYFVVDGNNNSMAPDLGEGFTNVPVAITENSTAAQVATALEAVMEAQTGISSSVSTATVTATNTDTGYCQAPVDHLTGFTFTVTTEGVTASAGGNGEIATTTYYKNYVQVAKLAMVYDANDNLVNVLRIG